MGTCDVSTMGHLLVRASCWIAVQSPESSSKIMSTCMMGIIMKVRVRNTYVKMRLNGREFISKRVKIECLSTKKMTAGRAEVDR